MTDVLSEQGKAWGPMDVLSGNGKECGRAGPLPAPDFPTVLRNPETRNRSRIGLWLIIGLVLAVSSTVNPAEPPESQAKKLLATGKILVEKTRYLEGLDLLNEARQILESDGKQQSRLYAEVLLEIAQTKIKGRLHQGFPAAYVKSALKEIQAANTLMEKLPSVLPQQLGMGYYVEGVIHKRFFMRKEKAMECFRKAITMDPGFAAAKRELSELLESGRVE